MIALLKLIPFRDWLWAALVLVLVIVAWTFVVHRERVAVAHELAAVQASSDKTKAAAQTVIDTNTADYEAKLKALREKRDADINAAALHAAGLGDRLRYYETHNSAHGVLQGASSSGAAAVACAGGDSDVVVPRAVFEALLGVEAAAEHDHAILISERAERDALTGK